MCLSRFDIIIFFLHFMMTNDVYRTIFSAIRCMTFLNLKFCYNKFKANKIFYSPILLIVAYDN